MKGYRTLAFSLAVAVFGVLQAFDWTSVVHDPKTMGIITTVIGLAAAGLRMVTTTAPGKAQ